MKSVIFICTGNICRSAMAHQYMQKRLKDEGLEETCEVSSCGISAYHGDRPTMHATDVMKKYGVNMEIHRAVPISEVNLRDYDLVLCMTEGHKAATLYMYPDITDKVYTLKEYIDGNNGNINISDPWGYDRNTYEKCSEEIVLYVDKLIDKFLKEQV